MKLWIRIPKHQLTNGGRSMYGPPISYDGVSEALAKRCECYQEYPTGDANSAEQYVPDGLSDYMVVWYGEPMNWDMDDNRHGRGTVAYTRCGKTELGADRIAIMNKCRAIFVASNEAQTSFASQLDLQVPVYVLSGGVKPEWFPYIERDYSANPFVFCQAGDADWRKGSDIACLAFKLAFREEQDVVFKIKSSGATPMFEQLRNLYYHDYRYKFIVQPVTDRSEMADKYYNDAHCLVYPSIMEGWGRCIAEAMMTGMPCISFKASSMLDQFGGECGWWIEPSGRKQDGYAIPNVIDLATKMRLAYIQREECRKRGLAGHRRAMNLLTWEYGVEQAMPILENIYESSIDSRTN
jgi:glycosyltransferase involved in cell wall biosynthesis